MCLVIINSILYIPVSIWMQIWKCPFNIKWNKNKKGLRRFTQDTKPRVKATVKLFLIGYWQVSKQITKIFMMLWAIKKSRNTIPSTFNQVFYSEFYLSFWSIKMILVCVGTFRKISKKNLIQTLPTGQRYNRFKLCNWSLEIFQQCFLAKLWQEPSLSQAFDVQGLPDT